MSLWIISFITGMIIILAMYYAMEIKDSRLKIPAIIAFSLLLMGETLDLLADIALNTILMLFAELLEMFITIGFFSLIYYSHIKRNDKKRKKKRKKKK